MPCSTLTLSGLAKDCAPCNGGIEEVYVINRGDISSVSVSSGKISSISATSLSDKFKKYLFKRNTASLVSTYTLDPTTGVHFVTSELTMLFSRMETTKRTEMAALSLNDLAVIVKDVNGIYWYLGYDHPVNASAGDGQTGTAMGDANRYSITLQDISTEMPYEVDPTIIDNLID